MTDPVKEQLSACLDGQLPEAELGLLLKQLQRDPQLRRSMGSYALIGEAMRGAVTVRASSGFADRIAAAIADEPDVKSAPLPRSTMPSMRWLRPAAGAAVAAGVAAIAVVALQPVSMEGQQVTATAQTAAVVADDGIAPSYTVPTNVDGNGSAFIPAARLTNYVVAHSEYSSPLGRRTVLSGVLAEDDGLDDSPDDGLADEQPEVASSDEDSATRVEVTGPQR